MFEEKTKVLIVTGVVSKMHDYRSANYMLRKSLEVSGHYIVKIAEEFRGVTSEALADYDLLLINYDGVAEADFSAERIPLGAASEKLICDFVKDGGGVMFFRSSSLLAAPFTEEYIKLCGARVCDGKYKPYEEEGFTVDCAVHTITEGVEPSWPTIGEAIYNHIELADDCTVLATVHDPVNEREVPVAWCREEGKGRVFAMTLGKQQDMLRRLDFCRLLLRGCDWAANGNVSLAMPPRDRYDDWMRGWPWYYPTPIGREY